LTLGSVVEQIRALGPGDHSCLIAEKAGDRIEASAMFFSDGLARGERCVYIADGATADQARALAAAVNGGADSRREGRLEFLTKTETYLRTGRFDPDEMIDFLAETLEQTVADGFSGLRVVGEMTWALGPEPGCERVLEYEDRVDAFFRGKPLAAICQYDANRFSVETLVRAVRTHAPALIVPRMPQELLPGSPLDAQRLSRTLVHVREGQAALLVLEGLLERGGHPSESAHAVREPLTLLALQVQSATREAIGSGAPPAILESLEVLAGQVDVLSRIVDDLLGPEAPADPWSGGSGGSGGSGAPTRPPDRS
jgi:hypothetical protein